MLNGQIERGVCLPAGDDLVVLIFAPEPVQVTYFSFSAHHCSLLLVIFEFLLDFFLF